ncbi:hypothetical protein V2G26_006218 [Clonostachys chloroleuca]
MPPNVLGVTRAIEESDYFLPLDIEQSTFMRRCRPATLIPEFSSSYVPVLIGLSTALVARYTLFIVSSTLDDVKDH